MVVGFFRRHFVLSWAGGREIEGAVHRERHPIVTGPARSTGMDEYTSSWARSIRIPLLQVRWVPL